MGKYNILCVFFLNLPVMLFAQDFETVIEKHREAYKAEFLKSSNSPLKQEDFAFLRFYEPDEKFKVECTFIATKKGTFDFKLFVRFIKA